MYHYLEEIALTSFNQTLYLSPTRAGTKFFFISDANWNLLILL